MPRNGSGTYFKPAGTTAVPNTTITSAQFNDSIDDIAAALNSAIPPFQISGSYSMATLTLSGDLKFGANDAITFDDVSNVYSFDADGTAAFADVHLGRLRITRTTDATLSSTGHGFQVGDTTGFNVICDNNEIMARNNGAASSFSINYYGGPVNLSAAGNTTAVRGALTVTESATLSAGLTVTGDATISGLGRGGSFTTSASWTTTPVIGSVNEEGVFVADSAIHAYRSSAAPVWLKRYSTTGAIMSFYYGTTGVGSISVTGSATAYNTSSDERLKEDFQPIDLGLIDQINAYDFRWKADGARSFGVKAQEIDLVMPQVVYKGDDEGAMWSVDYSKIVPLLIETVKDLRARLAVLEAQ